MEMREQQHIHALSAAREQVAPRRLSGIIKAVYAAAVDKHGLVTGNNADTLSLSDVEHRYHARADSHALCVHAQQQRKRENREPAGQRYFRPARQFGHGGNN